MRVTVFLLAFLLLPLASARAQQPGPIPRVAVDLRGFFPGLGQDATTARDLAVTPEELPGRAFGGVLGLNVYPMRSRTFAIGLVGEGLLGRARAQREVTSAIPGAPEPLPAPVVQRRVRGLSGGLTLNFGTARGWSYVTAGMGPMSFATFLGEATPADLPPTKMTINMGGGARWFVTRHVAFEFDVRFYLTRPEEISTPYAGRERNRLLVMSVGVGLK
jgi:hypothetical protein